MSTGSYQWPCFKASWTNLVNIFFARFVFKQWFKLFFFEWKFFERYLMLFSFHVKICLCYKSLVCCFHFNWNYLFFCYKQIFWKHIFVFSVKLQWVWYKLGLRREKCIGKLKLTLLLQPKETILPFLILLKTF